jgi:hypothetical protein
VSLFSAHATDIAGHVVGLSRCGAVVEPIESRGVGAIMVAELVRMLRIQEKKTDIILDRVCIGMDKG